MTALVIFVLAVLSKIVGAGVSGPPDPLRSRSYS